MKWFIRLLIILGMLITSMLIIGSVLPEQHTATASHTFQSSQEQVWSVLADFSTWPTWRSDLKEIRSGHNTFSEVMSDGEIIEYRIEEFKTPERIVTKVITPDLPYGGSWTYELIPAGTGCTLTITEHGEVYNPMFRFMAKYLFGHTLTMNRYLDDLKKKLQ